MSDIAAMVDALIAAGTPPGLAASIVAQAFAAGASSSAVSTRHPPDTSAEKRREWDREYRRNKRKHPPDIHPTPPDIHPNQVESGGLAPSLSKNSVEVIEKEERKQGSKKEREKDARASVHPTSTRQIPDGWEPLGEDMADAIEAIGADRAKADLLKFRDYHKEKATQSADWDATYRKWISRAVAFAPKIPPMTSASEPKFVPTEIDWDKAVDFYKRHHKWYRDHGPDPDSLACRCPVEILQKHGFRHIDQPAG